MPMLLRLSDIYLRNPGTVDLHTLRGQVHRVIPPRVREYSDEEGDSVVLTVILKDMPGVLSSSDNDVDKNKNSNNSNQQQQQQQQPKPAPARNEAKLQFSSDDESNDDDNDFSVEKQKIISNDPIVTGGISKSTTTTKNNNNSKDDPAIPQQQAVSTRQKMQNYVRVFFYDEWAKALSFTSPGDVLELRTAWHVFLNPETQIKSNIVGKLSTTHENQGSNAAEHLVTVTDRSDVSVYSKSDQDIIELCFNEKTLGNSEPVARVAKGIKF